MPVLLDSIRPWTAPAADRIQYPAMHIAGKGTKNILNFAIEITSFASQALTKFENRLPENVTFYAVPFDRLSAKLAAFRLPLKLLKFGNHFTSTKLVRAETKALQLHNELISIELKASAKKIYNEFFSPSTLLSNEDKEVTKKLDSNGKAKLAEYRLALCNQKKLQDKEKGKAALGIIDRGCREVIDFLGLYRDSSAVIQFLSKCEINLIGKRLSKSAAKFATPALIVIIATDIFQSINKMVIICRNNNYGWNVKHIVADDKIQGILRDVFSDAVWLVVIGPVVPLSPWAAACITVSITTFDTWNWYKNGNLSSAIEAA